LEVPPKRVLAVGDISKFEDDYWSVATGSKVLNNFQILEILSSYNPERITPEMLAKINKIQSTSKFSAESIKRSCRTA